ncbi:hypothetical protein BgiMline_016696 [Biomphalaria glabrata]|uniref:Uncharacterized protein LOC106078757 n=1 Tax=Biomphalaria glabrata TaxID=6526 RepID=A0A9U8EMV7_BIOGL|nr:uncharacterized protein LOC106078757 [Biomphalaria glabrata]XP_013095225.2 uncharacterized protein LOC106078757 [Biomphalaria glabrata]XP_013095239.2 uncharacterized protein LOC106078757 [Biomphalaria glabrata]KAI8758870.1 hypothetical protein BgiMline_009494 [Biomphalaria glabrata]
MKSLLNEQMDLEVKSDSNYCDQDVQEVQSTKINSHAFYRRHSSEDEGLEIQFLEDPEIDLEAVKTVSISRGRRPRSSFRDFEHAYDDSGFNSSDDDKDDSPNTYCDSFHLRSLNKDFTNKTEFVYRPTHDTECVDSLDSERTMNTPLKVMTAHSHTSNFELKPMTGGQLVIKASGSLHSVHSPSRLRQHRRRRFTDSNNNDTVNRLHSYFTPAPFKMNECFQDRGLICLMFCIAYTLLLFVLFGCIGLFMDLIRSALNKDDIEDLRTRFSNTRQRRMNVTSG